MAKALQLHEQLVSRIAELRSCLVAFSGGVDSAVVAKAAHLALGDCAIAVTGVSASLAAGGIGHRSAYCPIHRHSARNYLDRRAERSRISAKRT